MGSSVFRSDPLEGLIANSCQNPALGEVFEASPLLVCEAHHVRVDAQRELRVGSDHSADNALDFGMAANGGSNDGPVGDRIATAALVVVGWAEPRATAWARHGGLIDVHVAGLRIQIIWKTDQGGNHHDHVHVGVKRET